MKSGSAGLLKAEQFFLLNKQFHFGQRLQPLPFFFFVFSASPFFCFFAAFFPLTMDLTKQK